MTCGPLRVPAYSELDDEQVEILNLPLAGNHLVVGPPGSGKTIMALHRSQIFWKTKIPSLFLTHGKALSRYLDQAVSDTPGAAGNAWTLHSWLSFFYRKYFMRSYPGVGDWGIDWLHVIRDVDGMLKGKDGMFRPAGPFKPYGHIVVDEGQDFAKHTYLALLILGKNVTVFADENQKLHDDNSSIRDIAAHLGVDSRCCAPHLLRVNHRNTLPIALLAREFYAGLSSGVPELPDRQGDKPQILVSRDTCDAGRYIGNYAKTYSSHCIGVICPDKETVQELTGWIRQMAPAARVQSDARTFDFRNPAVTLVTYWTAKGLEFDTVFLPALDRLAYSNTDVWKMRLYVAIARARTELVLIYSGDRPQILNAIPRDLLDWGAE